jgi:hypothetical protein
MASTVHTCISYFHVSLLTDEHWTDVFVQFNKWAGQYFFNKKWRVFNFTVKGITFPWEDQRGGVLTGLFDDGSSRFDLEGELWVVG